MKERGWAVFGEVVEEEEEEEEVVNTDTWGGARVSEFLDISRNKYTK